MKNVPSQLHKLCVREDSIFTCLMVKNKFAITQILKADWRLFGTMTLIAKSKNLGMHSVFCHPIGPLPWLLANIDGTNENKQSYSRKTSRKYDFHYKIGSNSRE